MKKALIEKYRGSHKALGEYKFKANGVKINSTIPTDDLKSRYFATALIDGPKNLLELLCHFFKEARLTDIEFVSTRSFRQNQEAILVVLGLMDKTSITTQKLVTNYQMQNADWHDFAANFPEVLIRKLPNPGSADFEKCLATGITKFGAKLENILRIKSANTKKSRGSRNNKGPNNKAKGTKNPTYLKENESFWLAGLEKNKTPREYEPLADCKNLFGETDTDKRVKLVKVAARNKENTFNHNYKELLDTSVNPNSLEDYDKFVKSYGNEDTRRGKLTTTKTQMVEVRTKQPQFRRDVLKAYENSCCVTGYNEVSVLEAAHIKDFSSSRDNSVSNGLCLRADIHKLYDKGQIKIDENFIIQVDLSLMCTPYKRYDGQRIRLPKTNMRPSKINLKAKLDKFTSPPSV